jgi:RNA polymerase sigma-70 factor (ECF subfamily)
MALDKTELYGLIESVSQGDREAFSELYDATVSRVFGVVMRITSNKELAEEAVSDAYMQVWRSAVNYDRELAAPLTWIIMIARSRALDGLRRERSATKNQVNVIEDYNLVDDATTEPLLVTLGVEQSSELELLLQLLDNKERQMITLAFYRGFSHREIAEYTGEPLGSVKTILRRSQAILRAALIKTDFLMERSYEKVS